MTALKSTPPPKDVHQLKSFLGMVNHYNKFIMHSATIIKPLYQLLAKNAKWKWPEVEKRAFEKAKTALTSSSILVHFDPEKPIILKCDASPYGVGASLCHRMPSGEERPVAFTSRTITQAERNYSQLDRAAFSVMVGIKRFH